MATSRWLLGRQVYEEYGLSKKRLRTLREQQLIKFRFEGNRFLYLRESIDDYLNAGASEVKLQKAPIEKMVLSPTEEKIQKGENKVKWKNGSGKTPRINLGDFSLIETKGNGGLIYYIDYCDDKVRHTKNLGKLAKEFGIDRGIIADRKAAEVMGRKVRNALYEKEKSEDTSDKDITFGEFAELYLEKKKNKNSNSLKTVRSAIMGSLVKFFGDIKLSDLNLERTFKYVEWLRDNETKDSTIGNYLTIFGSLIGFAERYDYPVSRKNKIIHRNDYDLETTKRERELEKNEQASLFKVASDFWKDLLNLALFTGLRLGNICNLKWTSVDFDDQMIKIDSAESKNKEPIEIPMNSTAVELLKRMHDANGEHDHVFLRAANGSGKQTLKERWIQSEFKNLTEKAGIDDLHFHDLRRTFAMRLVRNGVDLLTLKKCMSHKNIASTMCYVTEDPKAVKRAFESLDRDVQENEAK